MNLNQLKTCLIFDCKRIASDHINTAYPQYKQLNIIRQGSGYTADDLDTMNTFIDAVRERCDHYEAVIESADNPESIIIDYSDITP